MLLISKTYCTITSESAENGESAEQGYISENAEYSFRDLVDAMQEYNNPSSMPPCGDIYEWLSNNPETDYHNGEETTECIHFSKDNPSRKHKYWEKAMYSAGIIKSFKG